MVVCSLLVIVSNSFYRYILVKYKATLDETLQAEINAPIAEGVLEVNPVIINEKITHPECPSDNTTTLETKLISGDADISPADLEAAFGQPDQCVPTVEHESKPELSASAPLNMHLNEISVDIKILHNYSKGKFAKQNTLQNQSITVRMAKRMKYIEQSVENCRVIEDFSKIYAGLQKEELAMGYTDTLCRRTLYRLLSKMSKDRKVQIFEIVFRNKSTRSQLLFTCHPDIVPTDELLISTIEKEKLKFMIRLNNEQIRKKRKLAGMDDDGMSVKKTAEQQVLEKECVETLETPDNIPMVSQKKDKPCRNDIRYGCIPKFHKARAIHEFFFYLVYDYPSTVEVIQPTKAIELWKLVEPRLNYDELLLELPTIYSCEMSWKMFVPPIPRYATYTEKGWFLLGDAVYRMPLSVFISISNQKFEVSGLAEMLAHPIRKHFLLCNLPPYLQENLMGYRKHIASIMDCCRRTACLGLLQFGPQRRKYVEQVFVYLNQHASQLNTITSEPGYYQTTEKDYEKTMYTFQTADDLALYWSNLHIICINTSLGKRMATDYVTTRWDIEPRLVALWQNHTREFVISNDLGEPPGDHRGAGGVDSALFAHLQRNWSFQHSASMRKVQPARPIKPQSKSVVLKQKAHNVKLHSASAVPAKVRIVAPIKRATTRRSQLVKVKLLKKRVKTQHYDDVDRQALRRMVKLRVDWSQEEDNLLLLCRIAMQTMFPTNRKLNVTSQQIRDILHWSLKSFDKTSRACQRRIIYMMKKEPVASKVHFLIQEIEQNRNIQNRYGGTFYQRLVKQIPDENECLHALRTHFVDLVYQLNFQLFPSDKLNIDVKANQLPDTLAEFHQMFSAKLETYAHSRLKYSPPESANDIEVTVMTSIIHSSCCCVRDKTSWNIQLYEIYKNYSDRTLSEAMSKVRNNHLISSNKVRSKVKSTRILPLNSAPYHLSVTYQFAMFTNIPVRLIDEAYKVYNEVAASASQDDGMPLRRIEGGCFMFIAELLHHQPSTQIDIGIPNPVLVFDTSKCPENEAMLQRINNRFRSIFQFVQNDNKQKLRDANVAANSKPLDDGGDGKKKKRRRVTISTSEHRTVGYYVSPVEKLMKMDDSMFHFFCVLNAIGGVTSVTELTIDEDKRCPFECVLGKENPVGAAVEIIHKHADSLPRIKEEEQMELSLITDFEIGILNVLAVFNVLVSRRFSIDDEGDVEPEEVTDHGMPALSMEILREDQDPNAMNVDMGENDTIEEAEPNMDAIIRTEEEEDDAEGDVDLLAPGGKGGDKVYRMHDYFFLNPCRLTLRLGSSQDLVQSDQIDRDAFLEDVTR